MAFAKKCKYCNNVQVVWDEHLAGPNKFKEVQTNQPHTRDRCDAAKNTPVEQQVPMYNPQEQKQFVDMYRPQQKSETTSTNDFQLAQLITKIDNLAIGMAKIMSIIQNQAENNPTQRDNMILRQRLTELEEVIKKKGLVTPANELQPEQSDTETQQDHDQHVRDMVARGRSEEELEL